MLPETKRILAQLDTEMAQASVNAHSELWQVLTALRSSDNIIDTNAKDEATVFIRSKALPRSCAPKDLSSLHNRIGVQVKPHSPNTKFTLANSYKHFWTHARNAAEVLGLFENSSPTARGGWFSLYNRRIRC